MSLLDNALLANLDTTPMNLDDPTPGNGNVSAFNRFSHQENDQLDNRLIRNDHLTDPSSSSAVTTMPTMYDDAAPTIPPQSVSQLTPAPAVFSGTGDESTVGGSSGSDPSPQSGSTFTPQPASSNPSNPSNPSNTPNPANPANPANPPNPSNPPGGSAVTEFTKRRNWPAKVIEELRDFLQILDANGRIRFASPSVLSLTGYTPDEITDKFIRDYIHPDDLGVFVAEFNESIATANPLRIFYRFRKKDGAYAVFEAVGHAHIAPAKFAPNPHNKSAFCQAVFMMARPYPTKNAGLLDSFLEHKMENERLRRRIAQLRKEEEADNEESQRQWMLSRSGRSDTSSLPGNQSVSSAPEGSMQKQQPLPSAAGLNPTLTRDALERVANDRPDSLTEKMARYEGSHADTIEMLTGLRYIEGERSKGITTGVASPALIRGDAGIVIPAGRDFRTGDKKKKQKTVEEYVCTDCGRLFLLYSFFFFVLFLFHSFSSPDLLTKAFNGRYPRLARMAQRAQRSENAMQRVRPTVGQEGEEKQA